MIKETIILAPGANSTELIRSLALYGKGSFGLLIYNNAYALATDMLLRKGVLFDNVVRSNEAQYMINNSMKSVKAFDNASFTDAVNLAGSLSTLRMLISYDEASQMSRLITESSFADKNHHLLDVYSKYRTSISGKSDTIDVIREAVKYHYDIDADFIILKEFPLLPLEMELMKSISNDNVRESSLVELFGSTQESEYNINYIKAYGNSNEVENVLNRIFLNKIPVDDCIVAVTDSNKYNQLFLEYKQKYNLDITFARGISISNTSSARLLRLYYDWDINGYHGVDSLMRMLYSSCFDMKKLMDKFNAEVSYQVIKNTVDRAGQLKFGPDINSNINKFNDFEPLIDEKDRIDAGVLKVLAEELGKDCASFISEYAVIENGIDAEALNAITTGISDYISECTKGSYRDIFENLLSQKVGRSVSRPGALIVTDIKGVLSSLRRHLFVIGLSANNFPGTVRENYLLLDEDMVLFGDNVPVSSALIERKKDDLNNLLDLYAAIGGSIVLSYSSYDLTGIKDENASSVLFEIYRKQNPSATIDEFDKVLRNGEVSYLQNKLSASHQVINSLAKGQILETVNKGDIVNVPYTGSRTFSPSALEVFFSCKKRFYLSNILGIEEPDPDDPFTVIDARDMGTLVHSVMEHLADHPDIKQEEFETYAESLYDDFIKKRIPFNKESSDAARKEFMTMAVNGYKNDPHNKVVSAEEKFSVMHWDSGIGIYGYPDRVEIDENGQYLIADYKTKRRYEHKENDIDSCLQVVLYAYMMSHRKENKLPISYCVYRYLRYREPVYCVYNREMEEKLKAKLLEVKEALDSGYFPCTGDEENCLYCNFASICGKAEKSEVSEDE